MVVQINLNGILWLKQIFFFCYKLNDLKLFIFVGHVSEQECKKKLRLIKS